MVCRFTISLLHYLSAAGIIGRLIACAGTLETSPSISSAYVRLCFPLFLRFSLLLDEQCEPAAVRLDEPSGQQSGRRDRGGTGGERGADLTILRCGSRMLLDVLGMLGHTCSVCSMCSMCCARCVRLSVLGMLDARYA